MQINNKFQNPIHRNAATIKNVFRDMMFIGAFRCVTIILGLIALKYIAVSFVATIKSSSPLFTVVISRIILKEKTSKLFKKFFFKEKKMILFKVVGQNFL
jgi:drug/metabolite transporter (DMT)-like permease